MITKSEILSELAQVVSGVEFTKIDPRRAAPLLMRGQKLDPDGGNDSSNSRLLR